LAGLDLAVLESSSFTMLDTLDEHITDSNTAQHTMEDTTELLYNLGEVQQLVRSQFQKAENSREPTILAFEVELNLQLMESVSLHEWTLQPEMIDDTPTLTKVRKLAKVLLLPVEYGSGYYWEIRNMYLNRRNKNLTGCATVYLGCTLREDREWHRPEDQPVRRRSEARTPIKRCNCMGSVTLTIDILTHHVLVEGNHQLAHEHPQYRQMNFPEAAKQWIQDNRDYNLRSAEIYRRLRNDNLISPNVHTKEQVYYWASIFSKETYMMNQDNQLLSAKTYLERPEFTENKVKVICYLDNDFVRALGFTTPLLHKIGAVNVTEIVIDSTFKTNQELFELFVVNVNCGGYGMPIAYLYLLTLEGTAAALTKPENTVNTRVQALCSFFSSLRNEGLLPVFVLTDKDAGEISAVHQAWSWTTKIQLCYWHLEHAIDRRLKDKKSTAGTYSQDKASEAHKKFDFIDPSWVPQRGPGSICPDQYSKELLDMIKRHANMHPLIPVAKETFWRPETIYKSCVQETYEFCHRHDLARLWGYLWTCWYNPNDWKLFSRSSYHAAMPIARTTMITESHWRVLKYDYKYTCNRPRLDRLTQILMKELLPDFEVKLTQYRANRGFPSWWKAFKKEWDNARSKDIPDDMDERYHIDVINWVCSCHAYLRSPYLLCKHLVAKMSKDFLPTFMETKRRHDYPLLAFGTDLQAPILQENNPWRRSIDNNGFAMSQSSSGQSSLSQHQRVVARQESMEARREELAEWKRVMARAFELCEKELDNDQFFEKFRNMMKPISKAVGECDEVLRAQTQQKTSGSKAGKLASWLR
jgi:hypothetical protein